MTKFVSLLGLAVATNLTAMTVGTTQASAPETAPCRVEDYASNDFVVCDIDVDQLAMFWEGENGQPYRTFSALSEAVAADGKELVVAMNAGMYDQSFSPVGLHIEDGEILRPVDARKPDFDGPPPNFYRQPNGVFYVADGVAAVVTTDDYLTLGPNADLATQSGPMLVMDGLLHPDFIDGGTDRRRRGGIGVCADGKVVVAISEGAINFFDFATMFRDFLGCRDALYLDGGRGVGIYDPALGRNDVSWHGGFGPMLGLVRD